jgi:hypothetical protein
MHEAADPSNPGRRLLDRLMPGGLARAERRAGSQGTDRRLFAHVLFAPVDIENTIVRAGDLLLIPLRVPLRKRDKASMHGRLLPLPHSELAALLARTSELIEVDSSWQHRGGDPLRKVRRILARLQSTGETPRTEVTPVLILRHMQEHVTAPITAASDDVAIFELLSSVGCRMPASQTPRQPRS